MDKVLFVVDMQEMYVGRGRDKTTYSYDAESLIDAINKRISAYKADLLSFISVSLLIKLRRSFISSATKRDFWVEECPKREHLRLAFQQS